MINHFLVKERNLLFILGFSLLFQDDQHLGDKRICFKFRASFLHLIVGKCGWRMNCWLGNISEIPRALTFAFTLESISIRSLKLLDVLFTSLKNHWFRWKTMFEWWERLGWGGWFKSITIQNVNNYIQSSENCTLGNRTKKKYFRTLQKMKKVWVTRYQEVFYYLGKWSCAISISIPLRGTFWMPQPMSNLQRWNASHLLAVNNLCSFLRCDDFSKNFERCFRLSWFA